MRRAQHGLDELRPVGETAVRPQHVEERPPVRTRGVRHARVRRGVGPRERDPRVRPAQVHVVPGVGPGPRRLQDEVAEAPRAVVGGGQRGLQRAVQPPPGRGLQRQPGRGGAAGQQHRRPELQRDHRRVVGGRDLAQGQRQVDRDDGAGPPVAPQGDVPAVGPDGLRLAVHRHGEGTAVRDPARHAQAQLQVAGRVDLDPAAALQRVARPLHEPDVGLRPARRRGHVEVDPDGPDAALGRRRTEVHRVLVLDVVLQPRAAAAGAHVVPLAQRPRVHGEHVRHLGGVVRVDVASRAQDLVGHGPLVVVGEPRLARALEQGARDLEHVVGHARLGVPVADVARDRARRPPQLVLAGAAVCVGAAGHEHVPQVDDGVRVARLAGQVAQGEVAEQGRGVLVGVHAVQLVPARRGEVEQRVQVEQLRRLDEHTVARQHRQVAQHLVHAACLARDVQGPHGRALLRGQHGQPPVHPPPHLGGDLQRHGRAGVPVGVQQTGHDLVARVVRRPDLAVGRQRFQARELPLAVGGQEPRVAVAARGRQRLLDLPQTSDQLVDLGLQLGPVVGVARTAGRERQHGQEVARVVAAQQVGRGCGLPAGVVVRAPGVLVGVAEVLPAARRQRAAGVQPGVRAEHGEQPVHGVDARQVQHLVAGTREDAARDLDVGERERLGHPGPHARQGEHGLRHRRSAPRSSARCRRRRWAGRPRAPRRRRP